MGGRRPYSLKEVIGSSKKIDREKAQLTESINKGNITGVSRSSANLILEHQDIAKILIYAKRLLSDVKGNYRIDELRNIKEISKKIRVDWADLKNREKLVSNHIIDSAVIDNVSRVLKEIK